MSSLSMFKAFMQDESAWNMYVTGPAGTGKTTQTKELVQYCMDNNISYVVCAYTHDACNILREKLPKEAIVKTLHSFLKKRPMINTHAKAAQHVEISKKSGEASADDHVAIMLLDEFSMVGEQDYLDIVERQDPSYEGKPLMKVLNIGDMNQSPPVGDIPGIFPVAPWWVKLTKIWRQAGDSELIDTLITLVSYIEGTAEPATLKPNKNFIRGIDIVKHYLTSDKHKAILAYTNKRVESLNAELESVTKPYMDAIVRSPTSRQTYKYIERVDPNYVSEIALPFGDRVLCLDTKYKTLEHLLKMSEEVHFADVRTKEDEIQTIAYVFGHYQYKIFLNNLKIAAAESNQAIEVKFRMSAKRWAEGNRSHPMARARAKAWRDFLTFKEAVVCLDFNHAMTIHKSQGSTYEEIYIDSDDLSLCSFRDFTLYLRLMYVAVSRAQKNVYTN